ncbi:uncharacterized protein [Haliotis cracherodii]|uniref:uncharacterized protein n=1 Tax=Haliotis cracherodii TaxID=6455 RepID=UPI0039E98068
MSDFVAAEEHGPLPPAVCYTASTHNRVPGTPGAVAAVALKGCFEHSRSCMLAAVGRNSLTEVEMPSQSGVDSPVPSSLDLVTSEKSSALILVTVLGIWGGESLSVSSDSRPRNMDRCHQLFVTPPRHTTEYRAHLEQSPL